MTPTIAANRRFVFSAKTSTICAALIVMMLYLSHWQWQRHLRKKDFISELDNRLKEPVVELNQILRISPGIQNSEFWARQIHRRVKVSGTYDFEHEVLIRNRRFENFPGVHLFTPLKVEGCDCNVLVNRGFVPLPLAEADQIRGLARPKNVEFVGLIKENVAPKFFSPNDPESGLDKPWVFAWLRPNIQAMAKQLSYPVLPVYLEIIQAPDGTDISEKIVNAKSGRDDIFFLPSSDKTVYGRDDYPKLSYPVPIFDTVIPPGRHLGYVFEWALMALMTGLIALVLQLRRQR